MRVWIDRIVFALLVLVALTYGAIMIIGESAHAAPVDVEDCVKWRQAGPWLIYVCEDDVLDVICIESESGFQSCKWKE